MRDVAKRIIDVAVAGALLVVLSPVLATVSVLIWATLGRPILFRQVRPGRFGEPFTLLKFRTMADHRDSSGRPLRDEVRLTSLGRFLRSTSLDELPELYNVVRGDMSLVGPRPLLMDYLPLYSAEQRRRHDVRPGITGWAQVNGRNTLTWNDKFRCDAWYVEHRSTRLDLKILGMTVLKVLRREGIAGAGTATMEPFRGNPPSSDAPAGGR